MHNSISKKLLAGALSVMMVLSLVAPTGAQAAAKYSLTQKSGLSTLKADKAYTYVVKGVKKTQYIKVSKTYKDVVVKKGSTTVKKATKIKGTGKTITLKVTCPDKVANYKNTLKVKVYNKKNNKLVKTLSKKATVKVTKFAIKEVVSTTAAAAAGYKYIRATFTKALTSLDASEVEISNKATGQIYSVEKVALATNGKSADITLVGDVAAAGSSFLQGNTDYIFKVNQAGAEASIEFTIQEVAAEVVVTAVDPSKKAITVNGNSTYTDKKDLIKDYNEIIGRTATFKYNKNNEIESFTLANEKVIYTAVIGYNADKDAGMLLDSVMDCADGNVYSLVNDTPGTSGMVKAVGNIYATREITLDGNATQFSAANKVTNNNGSEYASYAKIVLNANGTVRSLVTIKAFDKSVYVASVKDAKYLVDVAGAYTDMTGYTILKDGKTAKIEDVVAGDVVFVSANNNKKYAEIYSTNKATGKLTVYTDKVDIGADRFDLGGQAVIGDQVVAATTANLKDYDGAEVTAYLDHFGNIAQLVVTSAAVQTASEYVVVTEKAKMYTEGMNVLVSFNAGNGTEVKEYKFNCAQLKHIIAANGTQVDYDKTTNKYAGGAPAADFGGTFGISSTEGAASYTTVNVTDIVPGTLVKVTKTADGNIIGLELATKTVADYDFATTDDKDMKTTGTLANDTFAGGLTAMKNGELIQAATPVYVYNKTNKTVTLMKYSEVKFTATADAVGQIKCRTANGKVVAFYMDETKTTLASSAIKEVVRGIFKSATLKADGTTYADITVWVGNEAKTYKAFAQDVTAVTAAKGDFVEIALTKEDTVYGVAKVAETEVKAATVGAHNIPNYVIDGTYSLTTESGVQTTIVVLDGEGNYATKTWSELGTLLETAKTINVALYGGSTKYVDAMYVVLKTGAELDAEKAAYNAAKEAIDALDITSFTLESNKATTEAVKGAVKNAIEASISASANGYTVACTSVTGEPSVAGQTLKVTVTISKAGYTRTITNLEVVNPAA